MEEQNKSSKDAQKRDIDGVNDGPVHKKHKNEDIIVVESDTKPVEKISKPPVPDVTVIKVKTGLTPTKDGSNATKERKSSSVEQSPSSDSKHKPSALQRTSSFDSSRKTEKDSSKSSKSSSNSASSAASCTLDKTDRTSLNCLEQKLLELQKATQKTKPSSDSLSSRPKSSSPSGLKPSKDHHRRKEDFITERKKSNSSPKKMLKKPSSSSMSGVKSENKMGNLFCPTTDAKVTILPINKPSPKDFDHKPPTTSNSVTITKISPADSLHVPSSKDSKKVFSPKSKTSPESTKTKLSGKSFSKGEGKHKSEKHKDHKHRDKDHRSSSRESRDGRESSGAHNQCSKCNEQFSTKEAKKLHTCNSILDAHYLIDERDRQKTSPTGSVSEGSGASLSRSSSRSSSPGMPGVSGKKSSETSPKMKISVKNESAEKMRLSFKKEDFEDKVKKLGVKRDSPKEKWVESNKSSIKSDHSSDSRTSGMEPVKLTSDPIVKQQLAKSNGNEDNRPREDSSFPRSETDFTFSGKRTYSPSMSENISVDGKGLYSALNI